MIKIDITVGRENWGYMTHEHDKITDKNIAFFKNMCALLLKGAKEYRNANTGSK